MVVNYYKRYIFISRNTIYTIPPNEPCILRQFVLQPCLLQESKFAFQTLLSVTAPDENSFTLYLVNHSLIDDVEDSSFHFIRYLSCF